MAEPSISTTSSILTSTNNIGNLLLSGHDNRGSEVTYVSSSSSDLAAPSHLSCGVSGDQQLQQQAGSLETAGGSVSYASILTRENVLGPRRGGRDKCETSGEF